MALSTNTPSVVPTTPLSSSSTCPEGQSPDNYGNCITDNPDIPLITPLNIATEVPIGGEGEGWIPTEISDQTCQEQGRIACPTGECADTLEECPSIYDDYSSNIGYDPGGEFITDDPNTPEHNEALYDVYLAINNVDGPEGWTGLSFEDWVEKYGDTFPQWEGSEYEAQSDLLEAQLGLLKPELELKMESYNLLEEQNRWQTTTALEDQTFSREALIRSTGGLKSGASEERIKTAYDRVLEGFDYDQEAIDMERENSLIDFENRRLTSEFDLSKVVSDFQDNMWTLITANKAMQEGPGDGSTGNGLNSEFFSSGCDEGQLQTGWTENSAGQCVSPGGDVTDENEWIDTQELYTEDGEICNCSTDLTGSSSCFDSNGNSCTPDWSSGDGGGDDGGNDTIPEIPSDFCLSNCSGNTPYQCADCGCVASAADCSSGDYGCNDVCGDAIQCPDCSCADKVEDCIDEDYPSPFN